MKINDWFWKSDPNFLLVVRDNTWCISCRWKVIEQSSFSWDFPTDANILTVFGVADPNRKMFIIRVFEKPRDVFGGCRPQQKNVHHSRIWKTSWLPSRMFHRGQRFAKLWRVMSIHVRTCDLCHYLSTINLYTFQRIPVTKVTCTDNFTFLWKQQ